MLIVLNCNYSVPVSIIADRIRCALTPDVALNDKFTLTFKDARTYKILDGEGNVVHEPAGSGAVGVADLLTNYTDELSNEEAAALVAQADALYIDRIVDFYNITDFHDRFVDVYRDFGLLTSDRLFRYQLVGPDPQPVYADIINGHAACEESACVLTSGFGGHVIDQLRQDMDDVVVVNIIRNPSTSCAVVSKSELTYQLAQRTLFNASREQDLIVLRRSILNGLQLSTRQDVITVRYEDILANGGFNINDVFVDTSHYITSYNGVLDMNDKALIDNKVLSISEEQLVAFNNEYTNYDHLAQLADDVDVTKHAQIINFINETQGSNISADNIDQYAPRNIFNALGYEPLTFEEICYVQNTESETV